jgi:hypothetical protein
LTSGTHYRKVAVVFYFFDKRRATANHSSDAMRAMLAQLLYLHRDSQQVLDIASILFSENTPIQSAAMDKDIFAVLALLLDVLKFTFLVFDGIDECSDLEILLKRIDDAMADSPNCGLLLSGRSTAQLPAKMTSDCLKIALNRTVNAFDINTVLRLGIRELIDNNVLPGGSSVDDILDKISPTTNGNFLWVQLLIQYIKLPTLTLHDRIHAIDNLHNLEGLGVLYSAILDALDSQFPGNEGVNIRRLFQWVAHSSRPLDVNELHHALSAPFDRAQRNKDLVPEFGESLDSLSGSLLELSSDGSVKFIHYSLQELLTSTGESTEQSTNEKIVQYRSNADRYIAISCLSCLVHMVLAEPLSGSSNKVSEKHLIRLKYPLLRYSAEYWSQHFCRALLSQSGGGDNQDTTNGSWSQFLDFTQSFLHNKEKITVWIEASWLEKAPPEISSIADIEALTSDGFRGTELDSHLKQIICDIRELSTDLSKLNKSWSHTLQSEPNEIWEPSIQAFTPSRFWNSNTGSKAACLGPLSSDMKTICLQSQLSEDGTKIGLIKLIPSE